MAGLSVPRVLITAEETPVGKPHPAGYRLAAERLGAAPGDCLAVEDSPGGIRAARDAGMISVGITNTNQASALHEAHAVITSLTDLELGVRSSDRASRFSVRLKTS